MHPLVRKNFSEQENARVFDETKAADRIMYAPWTQFKAVDYRGKYVNNQGFLRKTVPNRSMPSNDSTPLKVFFMGGSTTYGTHVTDSETVPAAFTQLCKQNNINVDVCNRGVLGYISSQEYMLLNSLILQGKKPDKVIFLDGLNDISGLKFNYYQKPAFTHRNTKILANYGRSRGDLLKELWRKTNLYKLLTIMKPSLARSPFYGLPKGVSESQAVVKVVENYKKLVDATKKLCAQHNIDCYFFIQPVPYYNYPNRDKDPICAKADLGLDARFNQAYTQFKKEAKSIDHLYFLGDLLAQERGYPFMDGIHYSPGFCKKIAQQIFQRIHF